MRRTHRPTILGLFAILAIFMLGTSAQGFTESYCSSQNTGSTDVYSWQYQSNGNCTNHCAQEGTFAFAVIQWQDCYCSNYIPSSQQNINNCDVACPGFPAENCGSLDKDLYIYLKLSGTPSGTASAGGSPSQRTSAIVSSSPPPPPPSPSSTQAPSSSQVVVTGGRSSSTPQTSQAPQTSVQIVTESGAVVTRTVIQTPSPDPSSSTAPVRTGSDGNGPNVGAIAGGVAGGIVGLILIIGGLVFFLWRRRKQQQQDPDDSSTGNGGGSAGITRNTSTMSKAGLLGGATEVEHQYPPRIATNFSTQNSRYGVDHESISPISNRRNSQPLMIDSRLNPTALITYAGANASRESVASLDDSRDYGRQLNVRNPDP